jgi:hypothetical protein
MAMDDDARKLNDSEGRLKPVFGPLVFKVGNTQIIVDEVLQKVIVTTGYDVEVHSGGTVYPYADDVRLNPDSPSP